MQNQEKVKAARGVRRSNEARAEGPANATSHEEEDQGASKYSGMQEETVMDASRRSGTWWRERRLSGPSPHAEACCKGCVE